MWNVYALVCCRTVQPGLQISLLCFVPQDLPALQPLYSYMKLLYCTLSKMNVHDGYAWPDTCPHTHKAPGRICIGCAAKGRCHAICTDVQTSGALNSPPNNLPSPPGRPILITRTSTIFQP